MAITNILEPEDPERVPGLFPAFAGSHAAFADLGLHTASWLFTIESEGRQMKANDLNPRRTDWQSIALPIILMITGIVLLAGNFLGFLSLAQIQNLWPEAVIAIGVVELLPWCEHRTNPPREGRSRDIPLIR